MSHELFKKRQSNLVFFSSEEYKEKERLLREQAEADYKYWRSQNCDEMQDHSDDQGYDEWMEDED